jgi:bifunctional DNA-binding transcriptional regulator/antitoxin component of YhaV-PrlF toxin-antitoxin module
VYLISIEGKMGVVEIDGSGRLYIPASIRRRIPWKRFRLEVEGDRIILIPLKSAVDKYYGIAAPARFTNPEEIDDAAKVETEKLLRSDIH